MRCASAQTQGAKKSAHGVRKIAANNRTTAAEPETSLDGKAALWRRSRPRHRCRMLSIEPREA